MTLRRALRRLLLGLIGFAIATRIAELPSGPLNHHWTKNVIASPDGRKLYVTVGSNSSVAENGIDKEEARAAIREVIFVPFRPRRRTAAAESPSNRAPAAPS
jgi:hypothetical protein